MKRVCLVLWAGLLFESAFAIEEYGTRADGEVVASLYYLIANPNEFRGKVVETYGVIDVDFEDNTLFVDVESYKYFIRINGIIIDWNKSGIKIDEAAAKSLNGSWVRIVGTFYGDEPYKNECISGRDKVGNMCARIGVSASGLLRDVKFIQKIDAIQ